jgi:hypothetical protein
MSLNFFAIHTECLRKVGNSFVFAKTDAKKARVWWQLLAEMLHVYWMIFNHFVFEKA